MTRVHLVLMSGLLAAPGLADDWNNLKSAIACVGDIDGDGASDLVVAGRSERSSNYVWILSGKDGSVLRTLWGKPWGQGIATAIAEGDFMNQGGHLDPFLSVHSTSREWLCTSCTGLLYSGRTGEVLLTVPGVLYALGAVDADADGRPDVVVTVRLPRDLRRPAAPGDVPVDSRIVRVHSGRDGDLLYEIRCPVDPRSEEFGCSFSTLEDRDGDGVPEFALGSTGMDVDNPGHVYVYSGREGTLLHAWSGDPGLDMYGWSLAPIDDVDGDGSQDLLVGAASRCVEVRSGSDFRLLHRVDARYRYAICDAFASSLSAVGDVDFDCIPDWVAGANEDVEPFDEGYVWLVSGGTGRVIRTLFESSEYGADACGLGDVDADGAPDIALSVESKFRPADSLPSSNKESWDQDHSVRAISGRTSAVLWEVDIRALRSRTAEAHGK